MKREDGGHNRKNKFQVNYNKFPIFSPPLFGEKCMLVKWGES